jgi:hypothetical protein
MQQVTFANGTLWSAVTTCLTSPNEPSNQPISSTPNVKAGIAWFGVSVSLTDSGFVNASVTQQGYVAFHNANVFFPAVGPSAAGNVAIGFTISGPGYFPSTGYVQVTNGRTGNVHLIGAGVNSEDGFTGYPNYSPVPPSCMPDGNGGQICEARWGDYGASDIDSAGNIWLANEYIGPRPRTLNANWGTFVTQLQP